MDTYPSLLVAPTIEARLSTTPLYIYIHTYIFVPRDSLGIPKVQSQSGTGKTCVFCLGALQTADSPEGYAQGVRFYGV